MADASARRSLIQEQTFRPWTPARDGLALAQNPLPHPQKKATEGGFPSRSPSWLFVRYDRFI